MSILDFDFRGGTVPRIEEEEAMELAAVINRIGSAAELTVQDIRSNSRAIAYFTSKVDQMSDTQARLMLLEKASEAAAMPIDHFLEILTQARKRLDRYNDDESRGFPRLARVIKSLQAGPFVVMEDYYTGNERSLQLVRMVDLISTFVIDLGYRQAAFTKVLISNVQESGGYIVNSHQTLMRKVLDVQSTAAAHGIVAQEMEGAYQALTKAGGSFEQSFEQIGGKYQKLTPWDAMVMIANTTDASIQQVAQTMGSLQKTYGERGEALVDRTFKVYDAFEGLGVKVEEFRKVVETKSEESIFYVDSLDENISTLRTLIAKSSSTRAALDIFSRISKTETDLDFGLLVVTSSLVGQSDKAIKNRQGLMKFVKNQIAGRGIEDLDPKIDDKMLLRIERVLTEAEKEEGRITTNGLYLLQDFLEKIPSIRNKYELEYYNKYGKNSDLAILKAMDSGTPYHELQVSTSELKGQAAKVKDSTEDLAKTRQASFNFGQASITVQESMVINLEATMNKLFLVSNHIQNSAVDLVDSIRNSWFYSSFLSTSLRRNIDTALDFIVEPVKGFNKAVEDSRKAAAERKKGKKEVSKETTQEAKDPMEAKLNPPTPQTVKPQAKPEITDYVKEAVSGKTLNLALDVGSVSPSRPTATQDFINNPPKESNFQKSKAELQVLKKTLEDKASKNKNKPAPKVVEKQLNLDKDQVEITLKGS